MDQQIRFTKEMNALLRRFQQEQCETASYASQSDFSHFDGIANQISAASFSLLEQGLIQRVQAWNLFLSDIYGEGAIYLLGLYRINWSFPQRRTVRSVSSWFHQDRFIVKLL